MFIDLTPEQRALRLEIRDYFSQLMTPELRNKLRGQEGGEDFRNVVRQMSKDGWLFLVVINLLNKKNFVWEIWIFGKITILQTIRFKYSRLL